MRPLRLLTCLLVITMSACQKYNPGPDPVTPTTPTTPSTPGTACANATKADAENIAIFPVDNPWNTAIANANLDSRSAAIINLISANAPSVKADFGSGLWNNATIGIPYTVVCGSQAKVAIVFRANSYDGNYGSESDAGPFPIPLNAPVEGNGDGDRARIIFLARTHRNNQ